MQGDPVEQALLLAVAVAREKVNSMESLYKAMLQPNVTQFPSAKALRQGQAQGARVVYAALESELANYRKRRNGLGQE